MSKQNINVVIVDDSRAGKCDVGCGMDWSSDEAIAVAGRSIGERFGNRVNLEYIDLFV